MMALFTIAKHLRLHRSHRKRFLSQFQLHLSPQVSSPSFSSQNLVYSLCRTFHRTLLNTYRNTPHFTNLFHSQTRTINKFINFSEFQEKLDEKIQLGVREFVEKVRKAKDFDSGDEALAFLDENSSVKPDKDWILSLIWELREDWKLAFLVFKWGVKWDCVVDKTWCFIIWLLGNNQKFSIAWTLIHDLYKASMNVEEAMLALIDRYAAANYPDKAIEAFHTMQKFKFSPDQRTLFTFLNILCEHGNIEEAEEFMFLNKKFFPLETESFNIILNGWCNIAIDIYEAKRVWREMSKCCIVPNQTSYRHKISCFSRVHNLFDSLRLYDEMKRNGWIPGLEVYNSLIYVMTCENCLDQALKVLDKMIEAGLQPDSTTYNSMIGPLCRSVKVEEARKILGRMLEDGVSPTSDTYHAFLENSSLEGTFGFLDHMRKAGIGPSRDTFLLILSKYFKKGEPENALKMWLEMDRYEVVPDSDHYHVMVEGLANCGLIVKAREFYADMKSNGLIDDPRLKKLLEKPVEDGTGVREGKRQVTGKGLQRGKQRVTKSRDDNKSGKRKGTGA